MNGSQCDVLTRITVQTCVGVSLRICRYWAVICKSRGVTSLLPRKNISTPWHPRHAFTQITHESTPVALAPTTPTCLMIFETPTARVNLVRETRKDRGKEK